MTLKELKTGLFGYRKTDVYQYITELEEQFSTKLSERDRQMETITRQYERQLADLEHHLKALQSLEQERTVSSAPTADRPELQKMESETEAVQRRLEEQLAAQDRELEHYDQQLHQLRQLFHDMLLEMDASAEGLEEHLETTKAAGRGRNMSLFRRRHNPGT